MNKSKFLTHKKQGKISNNILFIVDNELMKTPRGMSTNDDFEVSWGDLSNHDRCSISNFSRSNGLDCE